MPYLFRVIWIATVVLASTVAVAEEFVVPLPDLIGEIESGWVPPVVGPVVRTTTFVMPSEVLHLDAMSLVVTGTMHEGWMECMNYPEPDTLSFTCPLGLYMTGDGNWLDFWFANGNPPVGDFALTSEIRSCCPYGILDPDDLIGATIEAHFGVDLILPGICAVGEDSWGTIADVHLVIQGPVAIEPTTWGAVKSLYR